MTRYITLVTSFLACVIPLLSEEVQRPRTEYLGWQTAVKLHVAEPSGLCWSRKRSTLFVVGDNGAIQEVYANTGETKDSIFCQSGYDWEGICLDRQTNTLYVMAERGNRIYSFSGEGHREMELFLDATLPGTKDGMDNYGCEGLECHDGLMYLGNQHAPCMIQTIDIATKEVKSNQTLTFCSFISDLCYDESDGSMWILESNAIKEHASGIPKLYNCSLPDFKLRRVLALPFMPQAEGLEIDARKGLIYVCCDRTGMLKSIKYEPSRGY